MAAPDLIVGLGHRKRVGKDTFGQLLRTSLERCGYRVFRISFAYYMKETAWKLLSHIGLGDSNYYEENPVYKEIPLPLVGKTPRQIWIEYGNAMRVIYPNIWVDRVRSFIDNIDAFPSFGSFILGRKPVAFVITDVRFPNEADAIRQWGGSLAVVRRRAAPVANDPAETSLEWYDGWEWIVDNNGTLEHLADQAATYANFLMTSKRK